MIENRYMIYMFLLYFVWSIFRTLQMFAGQGLLIGEFHRDIDQWILL